MAEVYGGLDAVRRTTNVVYSNGVLDQWSSAGITGEMVDPSGGALACHIVMCPPPPRLPHSDVARSPSRTS